MSFDFDLEPEFLALYEQCRSETLTSIERMYALYKSIEHIVAAKIPGDFAECGVWRGGSVMMMALAAKSFGDTERNIWLYDTFTGMTQPSAVDEQTMTGRSAQDILRENARDESNPFWGISPLETVKANLARTSYPMEHFRFAAGDVLKTLPAQSPAQLSLLRLDTDWYESTAHELKSLYPVLSVNGVLIVDDYGYWQGARKAVDEFFEKLTPRPMLHRIDYTGRICVKP